MFVFVCVHVCRVANPDRDPQRTLPGAPPPHTHTRSHAHTEIAHCKSKKVQEGVCRGLPLVSAGLAGHYAVECVCACVCVSIGPARDA